MTVTASNRPRKRDDDIRAALPYGLQVGVDATGEVMFRSDPGRVDDAEDVFWHLVFTAARLGPRQVSGCSSRYRDCLGVALYARVHFPEEWARRSPELVRRFRFLALVADAEIGPQP